MRAVTRSLRRAAVTRLAWWLGAGLALLAAWAAPAAAQPVGDAPVRTVVAPVLDIAFATADLDRQVRVETQPDRVKVTLDATVLFARDSARIRPQAERRLRAVRADLDRRGPGRLRVVGYTDDLGSAAHGLDLSRRRANAVAEVLRQSLPAGRYPMTVVGRGEADPAAPNDSEANRRLNRRVVIWYEPG